MPTEEVLRHRARYLRKVSTDAENRLWYSLRGRQLGRYKFKRQYLIGNYIVDFICLWKKLIIEVDGGQHCDRLRYDQKRTIFLENNGCKVLRFWNNEVLTELEVVLEIILNELDNR